VPLLPEAVLQELLYRHLVGLGYKAEIEVFFGGKRFDIVSWRDDELIGYEVKVANWRRAIEQLRIYQLFCHRVFLVKFGSVSDLMHQECRRVGIGILTIGAAPFFELRKHGDAQLSTSRSSSLTSALLETLIDAEP
jgi:hypothetical protein